MTNYNPDIHHRRSIRLKGYDYSSAGLYFITICVQNRKLLFGEILGEEIQFGADLRVCPNNNINPQYFSQTMILNDAGKMVMRWYYELENKFPDIRCHEMVVMPNHFHCIIENTGSNVDIVGADLCVCPYPVKKNEPNTDEHNVSGEHADNQYVLGEHVDNQYVLGEHADNQYVLGEHKGSPLRNVIQWFKTMTTNEYIRGVKNYGWNRFENRLWQRNYWEHIIRDNGSLNRIAEYIINNPRTWNRDNLNKS
jgi:putative transposase